MKFPAIRTLDTSKTPKAGDSRITAPVLASADLAKIAKQIEAIQAAHGSKAKGGAKRSSMSSLVPVVPAPTKPAKTLTAASLSDLADAILAARTAAGLSQIQVAAKLKTSQANVVRLEKGRSLPSTRTLQRIAQATGHKLVITFTR